MYIFHVTSSPLKEDSFMYRLHVKWGKNRLMMQSFSQYAQQRGKRPSEFLLLPHNAYTHGSGHIHIDIFIHMPGESNHNPFLELSFKEDQVKLQCSQTQDAQN